MTLGAAVGCNSSIANSKLSTLLLGPELYWVLAYVVAHLLAARNSPSTPEGNALLERMWWLFPLITVPVAYVLYLVSDSSRWLLLLRINVAAVAGLIFCMLRITGAIDYHDSRNSGLFAGFVIGLMAGVAVLVVCDIVAVVRFILMRRA